MQIQVSLNGGTGEGGRGRRWAGSGQRVERGQGAKGERGGRPALASPQGPPEEEEQRTRFDFLTRRSCPLFRNSLLLGNR